MVAERSHFRDWLNSNMKVFDSVVIACDHTPEMVLTAKALQGVLENFGLRVYFYHLVQKQHVISFLAQQFPSSDYVVLCGHGSGSDDDMSINFQVVDQVDGQFDNPEGWHSLTFGLTPANATQYIQHAQGTFISTACGSGRAPFAQAFLAAGYRAYIAPTSYYDGDATILFVLGFFYHLLAASRDYAERVYTDKEASERAAALDVDFQFGTRTFCYYE